MGRRTLSISRSKKCKDATLRNWKDPTFREKTINGMVGSAQSRWGDKEYRERHSENCSVAAKKRMENPEYKQICINNLKLATKTNKELMKDSEYVIKWVEACNKVRAKHYHSEKNNRELYYHSSFELSAFGILELDENVRSYDRCRFSIKYEYNGSRWYIPDILIEHIDGSKEILEIKANWACQNDRNIAKFEAAKQYCKLNGMNFNIWTENNLV